VNLKAEAEEEVEEGEEVGLEADEADEEEDVEEEGVEREGTAVPHPKNPLTRSSKLTCYATRKLRKAC